MCRHLASALLVLGVLGASAQAASAQSLTTEYNNQDSILAYDGVMFDVVAKSSITIDRFDVNLDPASAPSGMSTIHVYTKTGTLVGADKDAGAWTLVATTSVAPNAINSPTPLPISLALTMAPGERRAFYVVDINDAGSPWPIRYTSSSDPVGTLFVEDSALQVLTGIAKSHSSTTPFGASEPFDFTTASRVFNGTVYYSPTNQPPSFGPLADLLTSEDSPRVATISVSDDNTAPGSLNLSASSSNQALLPDANIQVTGAGGSRTITMTPTPNASGTARVDMVLSDGTLTTMASFTLTVGAVNDAPSFSPGGDVTVSENSGAYGPAAWATGISAGPADEGGQSVSFEIVGNTNANLFSTPPALDSTGRLTFTPRASTSGTAQITARLRDSGGTALGGVDVSAPASFTITVTDVNDPPTATAQSVMTTEDTARAITLQGVDPEGGSLTYTITSPPQHGTLTGGGASRTYTPDPNYNGADSFSFQVSDGGLTSAPATVSITITAANDPPIFISPTPADGASLMVAEGGTVSFVVAAQDIDGDPVTRSVTGAPAAATFSAQTGAFSWAPTWQDAGVKTLTLRASDGAVQITRTITVTITFRDIDGDGVPDTWEDANGLDSRSVDSDNDGISDGDEVGDPNNPRDSGGDATIDALAQDSDGDGVPDSVEAGDADPATPPVDSDNDGTPDYRDTDSDGDNVFDSADNCRTTFNVDQLDTDRDGIGNACEDDSDNDRVPDNIERMWNLDALLADTDGDTISDGDEFGDITGDARNGDGDAKIDALDDDSDNDGISDADEAGDADITTPPIDTDGDGKPDYRDADSDDDGVLDATDNCRLVKNADQADLDSNGVGDACDGDRDGDGAPDETDNCPDAANADQADMDGDGIGDLCDGDRDGDDEVDDIDNCPDVANPDQADLDGDRIGDACDDDADGDSVLDATDNCPGIKNDDQADQDGDGRGDVCDDDEDGDAIANEDDNCPTTANADQEDQDGDDIGDACDTDVDGDGLDNDVDECPTFAAADTTNGCPTGDKKPGTEEPPMELKSSDVSGCGCVQVEHGPQPARWPLTALVVALGGLCLSRRARRAA